MKLRVTVCIGSSCHLKGSRQVVESIRALIADHDLEEKVEVAGTFCLGQCQNGVCVTVGDDFFSGILQNRSFGKGISRANLAGTIPKP